MPPEPCLRCPKGLVDRVCSGFLYGRLGQRVECHSLLCHHLPRASTQTQDKLAACELPTELDDIISLAMHIDDCIQESREGQQTHCTWQPTLHLHLKSWRQATATCPLPMRREDMPMTSVCTMRRLVTLPSTVQQKAELVIEEGASSNFLSPPL